jgi:hypothetical protein
MAFMTKCAEYGVGVRSRVMAVGLAVMLATAGAWASGGSQERRPAPTRQPVPDTNSVRPDDRRAYEGFWKKLPKSKADALDRQLGELEARQRRGERIDPEIEKVRSAYPELVQMSATLVQSARWIVSSGGGTQPATCTGLGGIRRNGTMWCLGRLTT